MIQRIPMIEFYEDPRFLHMNDPLSIKKPERKKLRRRLDDYLRGPERMDKIAAELDPTWSSYLMPRLLVQRAQTDIMKALGEFFEGVVMEFGCGPDAYWHGLLDPSVKERWLLSDVQPNTIAMLNGKGLHNDPVIASVHNELPPQLMDTVVCFNCLDSIPYLELALENFYDALPSRGKVILGQDVYPAEGSTIAREYKRTGKVPSAGNFVAGGITTTANVWLERDGKRIPSRQYLASEIERVARSSGFEVLVNEVFVSEHIALRVSMQNDYPGCNLFSHAFEVYPSFIACEDYSMAMGPEIIMEKAAMDVIVLQKP